MRDKRQPKTAELMNKERGVDGSKNVEQRVSALEEALSQRSGKAWTRRRLWMGASLAALVLMVPQIWLWSALSRAQQEGAKEKSFWLLCHGKATPEERARAFLALVKAGNSQWRSARLNQLQLAEADLPGASLEWAKFDGSTLIGANLAGAVLTGSTFRDAQLARANLARAQLRGAEFGGAGLEGCDLRQADLRGAFMAQANLASGDFTAADLSSADLRRAQLNGANLSGAVLRAARLDLADFTDSALSNADLSEANWWRANGLTPALVAEWRSRFSPSSQADEKLRADFEVWLGNGPSGDPSSGIR